MNERLAKLVSQLQKNHIDACILTDYYHLKYFIDCSIHTGERLLALLLDNKGKATLFVNALFTAKDSEDYEVVYYHDSSDPIQAMKEHMEGKVIGIDNNWNAGFLLRLMEAYPANYVSGSFMMAEIRSSKDEEEQKNMIEASKLNDEVMRRIKPYLKVGVSEREIHDKLVQLFYEVSGGPVSFDPIVAFGKNGGDPHHESDDTILQKGEAIIIDMGCYYKGYCSDMTRTFLQHGNPEIEKIYDIVLRANTEAEKAIRLGMPLKDVDKVARDIITKAGYGPYFTHRLGHGIGIEVHEPYDVSESDEVLVKEGMCFSCEPGIYLAGVGGVRIEDLVIARADGALILNHYNKEKEYID